MSADVSGSTGTSSNVTEIRAKVNKDISGKINFIQITSDIVRKILSISLLLILMQSLWYLRNYLAQDSYDNVYITSQFKQFDKANAEQGGEKLLPLKKNESWKYVDTHSYRLGLCELAHCKFFFAEVGLHFVLFLLLTLFDYTLYYILDLATKYGSVGIPVQGQGQYKLEVQGRGPVADFYRIMVKNINNEHLINSSLELQECLPNPREPEAGVIPLLLMLYMAAVLIVVCRGYGMRLRRKIAAYFYPSQEIARIEFLHKKIRNKRIGYLKFLQHQVKSTHKEVKERRRLFTWLTFKFPLLAKLLPQREKLVCTSCRLVESRLHQVVLSKCKEVNGEVPCEAVYCSDCWEGLERKCPLCEVVG